MLHTLDTIVPVFSIILLGLLCRHTGYLPSALTGPLNRLVYYIALPAMIFRAVAEAPLQSQFNGRLLLGTLAACAGCFVLALLLGLLFRIRAREMGTFLQSATHGNLGYIGLAVVYYFLGKEALGKASLLAGFLMLLQNLQSVLGLLLFSAGEGDPRAKILYGVRKAVSNPIILAAGAGILFSFGEVSVPTVLERSLGILSGMALPLALLVIGASLSMGLVRAYALLSLGSGVLKLLACPALGLLLYLALDLTTDTFLPGMILLASPTATVTYVMALEMKGSPNQASASVSLITLLSSLAFVFWLWALQ